jgi:hypothetical protein
MPPENAFGPGDILERDIVEDGSTGDICEGIFGSRLQECDGGELRATLLKH